MVGLMVLGNGVAKPETEATWEPDQVMCESVDVPTLGALGRSERSVITRHSC
jgi:hypothetical protein